ncbi:MAG: amidotransferase [Opitutaceae bacterium]|jgi:GMP synthase-like glutamine amidotransferase|nr:amidotransferase [Opitutaceae bacterium]
MKIHWFQHVPFEGLGEIGPWLSARGHELACTRFYAGETPGPAAAACDWLVVMGGPMNIYQHRDHPWLRAEKQAIRARIDAGARVLGVCLGAQLIADALGARVYQNAEREIGWLPVRAAAGGEGEALAFPAGESLVFHWHGDTFDLPPGAARLASSEGCVNQAFAVGARVLGLQFHLEMGPGEVGRICEECAGELAPARDVQGAEVILAQTPSAAAGARSLLHRLLERMERG